MTRIVQFWSFDPIRHQPLLASLPFLLGNKKAATQRVAAFFRISAESADVVFFEDLDDLRPDHFQNTAVTQIGGMYAVDGRIVVVA